MASYQLTHQAQKDIENFTEKGMAQFGFEHAIHYFDQLDEVFLLLAENPKMGRFRNELKPPVRVHPFRSHVILYEEIDGQNILILTIRHSRESWLS